MEGDPRHEVEAAPPPVAPISVTAGTLSRQHLNNKQRSEKMRRIRIAADPRLDRQQQNMEEKQIEEWKEETGEDIRKKGKRELEYQIQNVLNKARTQAGLCYTKLPKELLYGEDLELSRWACLVDDNALREFTVYNEHCLKKKTEFVPLRNKSLHDSSNAVGLLTAITKAAVSEYSDNSKGLPQDRISFTGLKSLIIPGATKITDAGILSFANSITTLRRLNLRGCKKITDVATRALIKNAILLEELDLSYCPLVQGAGLVTVGEICHKLRVLKLVQCPASEEWLLKRLATGCPDLQVLDLSLSYKVTDGSLKAIANRCPKLTSLKVAWCKEISDVGVLAISENCRGLEVLDLSRNDLEHKLTDVSMLSLAERCSCLTILNLPGNEYLTDIGLSWLASGCRSLTDLNLAKCFKITDVGMRAISEGFADIKNLNIAMLKKVTDVGISHLASGCKKLQILVATGLFLLTDGAQRNFGFEGLQYLCMECLSLKELRIKGCFQVGSNVLKFLSTGIDPVTGRQSLKLGQPIRALDVSGLPKITSKALSPLLKGAAGQSLLKINLSQCSSVGDRVMALIGQNCVSLTSLNVSECENITSRGVAAFIRPGKCQCLQYLNLSFCPDVKDLALLALSEFGFHPGLAELNLRGCPDITEIGVDWLSCKVQTLTSLNLKGCEGVSLQGLKSLLGNWKYVSIRNDKEFFGIHPDEKCKDMRFMDEYGSVLKAATMIQNQYRAKTARREMALRRERYLMNWTACKLQSYWRGRVARKYALVKRMQRDLEVESAVKIQSRFRAGQARKRAELEREKRYQEKCEQCALLIQNIWRCKIARNIVEAARQARRAYMQKCHIAAKKMQAIWRGKEGRGRYRIAKAMWLAEQEKKRESCTKVQALIRGRNARKEGYKRKQAELRYEAEKENASVAIQRAARARQARKELRRRQMQIEERHLAATRLQCMWRKKQGTLAVHLRRQALTANKLQNAAIRVQCAWRKKKGQMTVHLLKMAQRQRSEEMAAAAGKIQRISRGKKARLEAFMLRDEKVKERLRRENLQDWAATLVQSKFRGRLGRKRAIIMKEARMRRWKEMYDHEQDRTYYFNQDTSEIRWRKPQDLLELLPRPVCSNCEIEDAIIECGNCVEYYCQVCWGSVHYGGRRIEHEYRSIYDAYGNRIDYGDGEWPSIWPTEIEQDEILGWQRKLRQDQSKKGEKITAGIPQHVLEHMEREQKAKQKEEEKVTAKIDNHSPDYGVTESESESESEIASKQEGNHEVWQQYWDDRYKVYYYYNTESGESTYEKPQSFSSTSFEDSITSQSVLEYSNSVSQKYSKCFDERYNLDYYYNHETGESTYERPDDFEQEGTTIKAESNQNNMDEKAESLWTKAYEPITGRAFYHNLKTGKSLFERPVEYETPRETEDSKQDIKASIWTRHVEVNKKTEVTDEGVEKQIEVKKIYYYNTETQTAQYDRPPGFVTPRKDKWIQIFDEELEKEYYVNETTGETQYMRPDGYSTPRPEGYEEGCNGWVKYPDADTGKMLYENELTGAIQDGYPAEFAIEYVSDDENIEPSDVPWERFYDEDSGSYYYFNNDTGETTYILPVGFLDPEPVHDSISGEPIMSIPEDGISNRLRKEEDDDENYDLGFEQ